MKIREGHEGMSSGLMPYPLRPWNKRFNLINFNLCSTPSSTFRNFNLTFTAANNVTTPHNFELTGGPFGLYGLLAESWVHGTELPNYSLFWYLKRWKWWVFGCARDVATGDWNVPVGGRHWRIPSNFCMGSLEAPRSGGVEPWTGKAQWSVTSWFVCCQMPHVFFLVGRWVDLFACWFVCLFFFLLFASSVKYLAVWSIAWLAIEIWTEICVNLMFAKDGWAWATIGHNAFTPLLA